MAVTLSCYKSIVSTYNKHAKYALFIVIVVRCKNVHRLNQLLHCSIDEMNKECSVAHQNSVENELHSFYFLSGLDFFIQNPFLCSINYYTGTSFRMFTAKVL